MSGTELSRLMAEVTAQPPLDVDFAAIARQVQRRQCRQRGVAAGAAALTVTAIIAMTAAGGVAGSHRGTSSGPGLSDAVTVDASWSHDSWNTLRWRTPPGWLPSDAYPDHSRPSNAFIEGPYVGTSRLPAASPTPRAVQGTGVLGSAGPLLPPNAVVAWFSYGIRDPQLPGDDSFDSDALRYLKAQCASYGATGMFHAVRQFGTVDHGSNLALDGCLDGDQTTQTAQLNAILASATDTRYPATTLGAPTPSGAVTGTVPTLWEGLHWATPRQWTVTDKHAPDTTDGVARHHGPVLSTGPLNSACAALVSGFRCAGSTMVATVGNQDLVAQLSARSSDDIEGDTGQFFPGDDTGTLSSPDADCLTMGGAQSWTWSHLYGPRSKGSEVTIDACLGAAAVATGVPELKALTAGIVDEGFPDLNAGTTHPTLLPTTVSAPRRAEGTTAAELCRTGLGPYASAELTTVAEIRSATWGPPTIGEKGRLAAAFPGAKASDPAAWCWTGNRVLFTAWVVHAGDLPVNAAGWGGWADDTPPSGAPNIP